MHIKKAIERVPAGIMVVPLLTGALLNTVCPEALNIGGYTTALFRNGSMPIIAAFFVCMGAQLKFNSAGKTLKKGIILTLTKYAIGVIIGLSVAHFLPENGLFGLLPLAIIAGMTNSNGGMYVALSSEYGDTTDVGATSILSFNDGPFFTMLALGASGLADIPFIAFVAVLVPIVAGMILGNLDEEMRDFLGAGLRLLIFFFSLGLGSAINLLDIFKAGLPGILLGVMTTILTGLGGYIMLRVFRERNAIAGCCEGSTAGNAVATPAAIALADPTYQAVVNVATVQCAAACITTAFLCPILVIMMNRWQESRGIYSPKKLAAMAAAKE